MSETSRDIILEKCLNMSLDQIAEERNSQRSKRNTRGRGDKRKFEQQTRVQRVVATKRYESYSQRGNHRRGNRRFDNNHYFNNRSHGSDAERWTHDKFVDDDENNLSNDDEEEEEEEIDQYEVNGYNQKKKMKKTYNKTKSDDDDDNDTFLKVKIQKEVIESDEEYSEDSEPDVEYKVKNREGKPESQVTTTKVSSPPSQAKLLITNLSETVCLKDIKDLLGEIGEVKDAEIKTISADNITAKVIMTKKQDAIAAVNAYNNITWKGKAIRVTILESAEDSASVISKKPSSSSSSSSSRKKSTETSKSPQLIEMKKTEFTSSRKKDLDDIVIVRGSSSTASSRRIVKYSNPSFDSSNNSYKNRGASRTTSNPRRTVIVSSSRLDDDMKSYWKKKSSR